MLIKVAAREIVRVWCIVLWGAGSGMSILGGLLLLIGSGAASLGEITHDNGTELWSEFGDEGDSS